MLTLSLVLIGAKPALVQKRLPRLSSFEWRGDISLETLGAGESMVAGLIEAPDLEDIVDTKLLKEELKVMLEDIPRREALIIKLRTGYKGRPAMTYEEIGGIFGVTRERIRQLEANGLSRLRHPVARHRLDKFRDDAEPFVYGSHDPPRNARIQYLFDD